MNSDDGDDDKLSINNDQINYSDDGCNRVRDVEVLVYSASAQMEGRPAVKMTVGEAVEGHRY